MPAVKQAKKVVKAPVKKAVAKKAAKAPVKKAPAPAKKAAAGPKKVVAKKATAPAKKIAPKKAPAASASATIVRPPHTFPVGKDGFSTILGYDMYGIYDRMGEGVMYEIRMTLLPSFFSAPLDEAWSAKHVKFESLGLGDIAYLTSYGASPKVWERSALAELENGYDFVELATGQVGESEINEEQSAWLEANGFVQAAIEQLGARAKKMVRAH